MTRVQYAVNGLALLALTVGLAIYDARDHRDWRKPRAGCAEDRPS